MKNDLFNQALLKKYKNKFQLNPTKQDHIKEHLNKLENRDLKSETSNYLYFYDKILKGILGYKSEDILFDQKEDQGQGKSEFVLKDDNDKKFMIIELKGQGIDLDKKQKGRSDNKSPVEQAFGYAFNTGDVDWLMVSNYDEFRLYNYHEKTKYISFNAEELLDKDSFHYFMLSFSRKSHIESDFIKKAHEGTLLVDKKLASEFYKLYNETRLMLIKELETTSQCQRLEAIKYAQLILNRYMFICFAEDTGLLPSQISVDTIATPIQKGNVRHGSIWQRINELFLDIQEGNPNKKIPEYNGGLFLEDLHKLRLRDLIQDQSIFKETYQDWKFEVYEKDIKHLLGDVADQINPIYKNLLTISSFDFSSELDVNILGHIFENSIGDIEDLKADIKGRRKKEGIYYTPDYITDYICRNTIIPYLSKSGKVENVSDLLEEYSWSNEIEDLDEKLKDIKIVDPACGSGAFLNKATDILLEIHEAVYNLKKGYTTTTGMRVGKGKRRRTENIQHMDLGAYVFDQIEKRREILLNNIYGVDLNEESVEITKLSLFLKVCRKNLKLPNLDKNIKNGNSVIDDPAFTDKPFDWDEEFPEIFKEGGFDVVIGNPPYVRQEKVKDFSFYFKEYYDIHLGKADLYVYFFEKGMDILKNKGILTFICSNKFIRANYGKNLRRLILKNIIRFYNDYSGRNVFGDVAVDPCIISIKKDYPKNDTNILINNDFEISQNRFNEGSWSFEKLELLDLKIKIQKSGIEIRNIKNLNINFGVKTGYNKAFIISEEQKNQFIAGNRNFNNFFKPVIRGKDVERYKIDYKNLFLLYIPWKFPINDYKNIENYLLKYKDSLKKRPEVKTGRGEWYSLSRYAADYYQDFSKEKIVWTDMAQIPSFMVDMEGFFPLNTVYIMTLNNQDFKLKFILALLNSKLLFWYIKRIASNLGEKGLRYFKQFVEQLPIFPATLEQQRPFIEKTDLMLKLNRKLQEEINGFKHWIKKEFNVDKMSKKLEKYYELSEDEFINELRKKKVDTKSRKNREYLEREFNESLAIIKPLLNQIEQTDKEMDQMVYQLYGLTEEEIQIIEQSG
jgi:hypothetical protein